MAGYWTRLQFLLKVLIDLDSVSVHKMGGKKNLADIQLSVTSPLVNNAYISCFRALLAVKSLRQIYKAVLK